MSVVDCTACYGTGHQLLDFGTAPQVGRALATLVSWSIASDRRGLMLSVTYATDVEIVTTEVEYEYPGIHGDLPRCVEDTLCADVERHYSACEVARYFERDEEVEEIRHDLATDMALAQVAL